MIDTINFLLTANKVGGVDFLADTTPHLDDVGVHDYGNGCISVSGRLGNFNVIVTEAAVKVRDGSLCKHYLGDNFKTMGRRQIGEAVESLSDELHLPMGEAKVTRLDVAANIMMKYPPEVYFPYLGDKTFAKRLAEPHGIYYVLSGGRLCFYDKVAEQKAHKDPIPELYAGKNVLRYEQRYIRRINKQLLYDVTGGVLSNEYFYKRLLDNWLLSYKSIKKLADINVNFEIMSNKKDFERGIMLLGVNSIGGQEVLLQQIAEAQKKGILKRKQAYDLRQKLNDVCSLKSALVVESGLVSELDKKMQQAIAFYR